MTAAALALALTAAAAHALWNLVAKRREGDAAFLVLVTVLAVALYLPAALADVAVESVPLRGTTALFVLGSGALHASYFVLLLRGYRGGDLGVVYPGARALGLVGASAGAIALYGERPGPVGLAGIALVALGVTALGRPVGGERVRARALAYAAATGVAIAGYTLWDRYAVRNLGLPPVFYYWGSECAQLLWLAPAAWLRRRELAGEWTAHRGQALAIGFLSPLAYLLVLVALTFAPVSLVIPVRESSVLLGAVLGARVLGERGGRRRLAAAAAIVAGLVAISVR